MVPLSNEKIRHFLNPNIQPRGDGYYDRFNRDHDWPTPTPKTKRAYRWKPGKQIPGLLAALAVPVMMAFVAKPVILGILSPVTGCNIKGNVSSDGGERIYHVPGQQYYDATKISPQYGEKFFCSEAEARKAGWRKSGIWMSLLIHF